MAPTDEVEAVGLGSTTRSPSAEPSSRGRRRRRRPRMLAPIAPSHMVIIKSTWTAMRVSLNNAVMQISAPVLAEDPSLSLSIAPAAKRRTRPWLRILTPLALLVLWQVGCSTGFISPRTLAAPSQVIASFIQLTSDGALQHHLLVSLGRVAKGMTVALLVGGSLALAAPANISSTHRCKCCGPCPCWR